MKKYNITVNGNTYEVFVEEADATASAPSYVPAPQPVSTPTSAPSTPAPKPQASASCGIQGSAKVNSPMPGTILDVKVSVGQAVKKGDVICVLEAMKMENDIPAPQDGVIASINVQKGASVNAGDVLATLN